MGLEPVAGWFRADYGMEQHSGTAHAYSAWRFSAFSRMIAHIFLYSSVYSFLVPFANWTIQYSPHVNQIRTSIFLSISLLPALQVYGIMVRPTPGLFFTENVLRLHAPLHCTAVHTIFTENVEKGGLFLSETSLHWLFNTNVVIFYKIVRYSKAMFTLYRIVKRSVAETDPVQCEQEQVLPCIAGITSFKNGAK